MSILTASSDETSRVWDAANGKTLLTLQADTNGMNCVSFSPDGQRIVTGSLDQTAKVWDGATGSRDGTAKVWDAAGKRDVLILRGHTNAIMSVGFSPNGHRMVTGGADQVARVWDAASGRELLSLKGHTGSVGAVSFFPDGQRIVTGGGDISCCSDGTLAD